MLKELKEFLMKGNVLDLAIAVVIGGAFGKIVDALVKNIITPLVGILLGGINFEDLAITVGSANVKYGIFIQAIIDFLIIGVSLFFVMKAINKVQEINPLVSKEDETEEEQEEEITKEQQVLIEIRDLLKSQKE